MLLATNDKLVLSTSLKGQVFEKWLRKSNLSPGASERSSVISLSVLKEQQQAAAS